MTYEEFWEKDYRLVESYIKKNELDIERETASNWELVMYIRASMLEIVTNMYKDPKKGGKPYKFPDKPQSRTRRGQLRDERNKNIATEIRQYFNERLSRRKEKSDGND